MQQQKPKGLSTNFHKQTNKVNLQEGVSAQNQSTLLNQTFKISEENRKMDEQRNNEKVHYPPSNILARNRRYWMLKKLWKQGYFQQEQIMLKFPHLYYQYVGKYKKNFNGNKFSSISQFLQSQIVNSEYRHLIEQKYQKQKVVHNLNLTKNKQKPGDMESETQNQQINNQSEDNPFEQKLQQISEDDLNLQEQALIDFIQLQFIQGLLPGFNYQFIDNDSTLDDRREIDDNEQQQYFNSRQGYNQEDQEVEDPENNTNIQDF